jgi:hypothetical protein
MGDKSTAVLRLWMRPGTLSGAILPCKEGVFGASTLLGSDNIQVCYKCINEHLAMALQVRQLYRSAMVWETKVYGRKTQEFVTN